MVELNIFTLITQFTRRKSGFKLKDCEEVSILYGEATYVILYNFSFIPCCMNYICMHDESETC